MPIRYLDLPSIDIETAELSPQELDLLGRVVRRVGGLDTLEQVVDYLFTETRPLWPCDRIGLAFLGEDGLRVTAHYAVAGYEPLHLNKGYAEGLRGSSLEAVIRKGTPRVINDLPGYLETHPHSHSTQLIVREGIHSSMTCPLSVDGDHVGLMFISAREPDAYTDRHLQVNRFLVERLSQVIEKTHQAELLKTAISAYFEMLSFVVHELKSPVASLVTDANLMLEGYLGELTDEQRRKLHRMIGKSEYLLGLVREYLDLARMEQGTLEPSWDTLSDFADEVLEPSIEMVQPQMDEKKMHVERRIPEDPVEVRCDAQLLKIVLINLIGNAAKYGREGGRIEVRLEPEPEHVSVAVWNEGPGFPEEQKHRLFRKFSRLQTDELLKRKGTGVGLYTTWRIIHAHHGRIRADSKEGEWAEFRFRIPRRPPERDSRESS